MPSLSRLLAAIRRLDDATLAAAMRASLDVLTPTLAVKIPEMPPDAPPGRDASEQNPSMDRLFSQACLSCPTDDRATLRAYRIPLDAVDLERSYLDRYNATDSFKLMLRTLDHLSFIVLLLERAAPGDDLPEYFIQMLGDHLRDCLEPLQNIGALLARMEKVEPDDAL